MTLPKKYQKKYKVDPDYYDEEYFLTDHFPGTKEYKEKSYVLTLQLEKIYGKIPPTDKDLKFLDAGCGRGELLYLMAKKGYEVYGVDYSDTAVRMSRNLLKNEGVKGTVIRADVRETKFPENFFDVVVSSDVMAHLDDNQASLDFVNEIYRILKPNGKFHLETAPNKLYIDYFTKYYLRYINLLAIPLYNLLSKKNEKYKATLDLRSPQNEIAHVNEQTYFSLRGTMKKSLFEDFKIEIVSNPLKFSFWKLPYYIFGYFYPLNRLFPLNILLGTYIYCEARK